MKSMMRFLLLILCSLIFTGCASVNMAPASQDSRAKNFKPEAEKATIYVYRNETFGAAVKMPVLLNGYHIADTIANSYLAMSVSAGNYQVTSKTENDSTVDLKVESEKNYFIWQEVKMGVWGGRSQLQVVSEEKGKAGVLECKLVQQKHLPNQAKNAEKPGSASASPALSSPPVAEIARPDLFLVALPSGYARIEEIDKAPIRSQARIQYQGYLANPKKTKAFLVANKGGFYSTGNASLPELYALFDRCLSTNPECWLYALGDQVVWSENKNLRINREKLQPLPLKN